MADLILNTGIEPVFQGSLTVGGTTPQVIVPKECRIILLGSSGTTATIYAGYQGTTAGVIEWYTLGTLTTAANGIAVDKFELDAPYIKFVGTSGTIQLFEVK